MDSSSEGLSSSTLRISPRLLQYRQEKNRKDAYRKEISGLSSAEGSADSPFDNEAAARVALKHGDLDSALSYRRMAAEAKARSVCWGTAAGA